VTVSKDKNALPLFIISIFSGETVCFSTAISITEPKYLGHFSFCLGSTPILAALF